MCRSLNAQTAGIITVCYDTWASKTCPILNEFAALIMIAQCAYCKIQEHAAMVCLFRWIHLQVNGKKTRRRSCHPCLDVTPDLND